MGRAFEYRRASKEARWDKMSKLFPKLAKAITVAAKEGGSDPDMNPKLRSAIATAKAQNMPKDNIDAAIKRASVFFIFYLLKFTNCITFCDTIIPTLHYITLFAVCQAVKR